MPVGSVGFAFVLAAVWVALPVDGFENGSGGVWRQVFLIPLAGFSLCFILQAFVFLFNWPKRIVAPHLRSQAGALSEYRDKSRTSRNAS